MADLGPEQQTEPPRRTPSSGTRMAVLAAIGVVVAAGFGALAMVTSQGDDAAPPRGPVATTTVQTTDGNLAPPASTATKTKTNTKMRTETNTRTRTNTNTETRTNTQTDVRTDVRTQTDTNTVTATRTLPPVTTTVTSTLTVTAEPEPSG